MTTGENGSGLPPLRVVDLEREEGTSWLRNTYKLTANVNLWGDLVEHITYTALTMERILTKAGVEIDYARCVQGQDALEPAEMWVTHPKPRAGEPELSADTLNEVIAVDTPPGLRITHSAEHPGLLLAHRDVPYGRLAIMALGGRSTIVQTDTVTTGPGSGVYSLYPENTLMMALAEADADIQDVEQDMRELLTL